MFPRLGRKRQSKWLTEFGSLQKVVENAEQVSGKIGESLRAHLDQLEMSRELATVKCDIDTGLGCEDLEMGQPDIAKLRELYQELEFRNWLSELDKIDPGASADLGQ